MSYNSFSKQQSDENEKVRILKNTIYYLGSGYTPETVFVTNVNANMVTYKHYPYYYTKEIKIELTFFKSLIISATKTKIAQLKAYIEHGAPYGNNEGIEGEIVKLSSFLTGSPLPEEELSGYKMYEVKVKRKQNAVIPENLFWYYCEKLGGGCGMDNDNNITINSVKAKTLSKIKKDKNLTVLSIKDDQFYITYYQNNQ